MDHLHIARVLPVQELRLVWRPFCQHATCQFGRMSWSERTDLP
jgi:hypothetical protein